MSQPPQKSVLVTGCSADGAGASIAMAFQKRNCLVFATTRNISKIPDSLTSLPNVVTVPLDVTSDESVQSAVKSVHETLAIEKYEHLKGLDVLVNNAGVGWWAPILDVPMTDAKAIFETNFFGPIRVLQAFSHDVIKARGTVVNVSSLGGEYGTWGPFQSIYEASKAALSQASEAWRLELEPLSVRVITLVMGVVKTQFFSGYDGQVHLQEGSYYQPIKSILDQMMNPKPRRLYLEADDFGEQVVRKVVGGSSGRVFLGGLTTIVRVCGAILPEWVIDWAIRSQTPDAFKILRDSRKGVEKI